MVITAGVIIYFTQVDIGKAMLDQQNLLSKHILYLIDLNIRADYTSLIDNKINSVLRYKGMLKSRTQIILKMIEQQNQYINKKEISYTEAKHLMMDWVEHSGDEKLGQLIIADNNLNIIAHPDKSLIGSNIGTFKDMKKKTIRDIISSSVSGTRPIINVFSWVGKDKKPSKYLACFRKYEKWNWIIGSLIVIDDIEVEAARGLDEIIEILKQTFAEIKIAKTGFAFLFDNSGNILAMTDESLSEDFAKAQNSVTNKPLFKDMIQAVSTPGRSLVYQSGLFQNKEYIAYVSYFKPLGWYFGVTVPVSEIKLPVKRIVSKQTTLIAIVLLCSLLITAWLVSQIAKPLNLLSEHAKAFSSADLMDDEKEESDTAIAVLPEKFNDEVGRLAASFIYMKTRLKENVKQLVETTAKNERIEGELNIATEIQLGILPKVFPPFPEKDEIEVFASLKPAKEVGGDLYDYYFIDDDRLCFTMGDVSGKGVPAALMMVITKTLIKSTATKEIGPARIMMEVNNAINDDNPKSMFVTLIIGILDLKTGKLAYANGGHNPPVLIDKEGKARYVEEISGPVVGVMEDMDYKELNIDMNPGDAFFMYTDGVNEAMNINEEFYSDERLIIEIAKTRPIQPEPAIKSVSTDIDDFVGEADQYDDMAMLMIKYTG